MTKRCAISVILLSLVLVACGGSTEPEGSGPSALALAGSGGQAGAGAGAETAGAAGAGGEVSATLGAPCNAQGGGTCGPTEYCSYRDASACGVGGTCVARPGGCITIGNPKQPCMCSGARTWDACIEMTMRGDSLAPFAAACHPGEADVVCSSDPTYGPGCGTREYCDTAGAAGSSTTGVCRPLPAP